MPMSGPSSKRPRPRAGEDRIETERGPWVAALVAAGYEVFAINPKATSRYRDRHSMSGGEKRSG